MDYLHDIPSGRFPRQSMLFLPHDDELDEARHVIALNVRLKFDTQDQ